MEKKPFNQWTPRSLLDALLSGSQEEKLAVVKEAGILTADGQLAPMYQSWGDKASRTPGELDEEESEDHQSSL